MGINWGADNNAVNDFMAVHAVEFPCASGLQGLGNDVNLQYDINSHITALVVTPDRQIVGQFYDPYFPERDTLNSLLISLGAEMQDCTVGINSEKILDFGMSISPNPVEQYTYVNVLAEKAGLYHLKIISNFGHIMQTVSVDLSKGENRVKLDFSSFATGIYLVQLQSEKGQFEIKKIVKQ